jgi:hypothetical protein
VWDLKADPLAVRETVESTLSRRELLRAGAAEERPGKRRQEQGGDEWGAPGASAHPAHASLNPRGDAERGATTVLEGARIVVMMISSGRLMFGPAAACPS